MTHITCRLTAKNRDQLRNHTLGNRVWAAFTKSVTHGQCEARPAVTFPDAGEISYAERHRKHAGDAVQSRWHKIAQARRVSLFPSAICRTSWMRGGATWPVASVRRPVRRSGSLIYDDKPESDRRTTTVHRAALDQCSLALSALDVTSTLHDQ